MNKFITALLLSATGYAISYGATTNIVGTGTETVIFSDLNFSGSTGEVAAALSELAQFDSLNTIYSGGIGFESGVDSAGSTGLLLQNIDVVTISNQPSANYLINGGNGGGAGVASSGSGIASALGGVGISANAASTPNFAGPDGDELHISGASVSGGNGGQVSGFTGNTLDASAGTALFAEDVWLHLNKASFTGGMGGSVIANGASATAKGGDGILTGFDGAIISLNGNVSSVGGNGGAITSTTGGVKANASGGWGVNHQGLNYFDPNFVMNVSGGHYEGGAGGVVTGQGGVNVSGGNAFYFNIQKALITDGTFIGGAGGTAVITNSLASANVDGGVGLYAFLSDSLEIQGGTFSGGVAGTANGVAGSQGAALRVADSYTTISGGTFSGFGLLMETTSRDGTLEISDGSFGDIQFSNIVGFKNTIDISGGTFGNAMFDGAGINDATITAGSFGNFSLEGSVENNLTFGGSSSYGNLYLGGTGVNTLSISNGVTSSGMVMVSSGTNNVNLWNDDNFVTTTVSNGLINFNNQNFNLQSGSSFALQSQDARANFNGGLSVKTGSTLDVGLGQVAVTTFTAESGSSLVTTFSDNGSGGVTNGLITGDALAFEQGLTWTLKNDGSATNGLSDFLLASANTILTQDLAVSDIVLEGDTEWLNGINGVTNYDVNGMENLYATYGALTIKDALGAEGEFGKAMEDFNTFVEADPALAAYIGAWSEAEANSNLKNSYVRTPEMANAMIGLQSVFADQIKDRTRSHLRLKNFGSTSSSAPRGAAGPSEWYDNVTDWTRDTFPSWDSRGATRSASDNAPAPAVHGDPSGVGKSHAYGSTGKGSSYDNFVDSVQDHTPGTSGEKIEVPETYQVWGRGYGSRVDQNATGDHVGYNATIAGGILGIDKRFSNLLLGLGAGYARTSVEGNAGNDGTANTGHVVGYFSTGGNKFYLDANLNYAFNDVETEGLEAVGYKGEYNAHTVGASLGMGYGMSGFNDTVLFTPEISILSTYYNRDAYTETSSLGVGFPDKAYDAYDQWSHLSALGATLSMIKQIESFNLEMEFQPELRAHWLHEFNAQMDDETYTMVGVPGGGQNIGVSLQAREEDLIKIGGGVRFSQWQSDTTEFGLDLDGVVGQDYKAFIVSGKIMHRF